MCQPDSESYQLVSSIRYGVQYSRNAGAYKIASEMRSLGHDVEVFDFATYFTDDEVKKFIDSRITDIDVVGWSSQFFYRFDFYHKWCNYIKSIKPTVVFIAGGPKVLNLLNFTQSKYLIAGYAEFAIADVLAHIEKKPNRLKFKIVNGQYYVDCNEFYKSDVLPSMSIEYNSSDCISPEETLTLGLSRGCVFKCSFCTYPGIGKKKGTFIRDGAQSYYNEMITNYEKWGTTWYYLSDETVNDSIDKLLDLEEAVLKLPFKPTMIGFARLDLMARQREYWEVYKNIGFTHWQFGIESFNHLTLKAMNKGYDPKKLKDALFELKDFFKDQIHITASFIVGGPYDTPESLEETMQWLDNEGNEIVSGLAIFSLNLQRESEYAVGSEFSRNYQKYGYREMTDAEIKQEMLIDPTLTLEIVEETKRYNILWINDYWNVFSAERIVKKLHRSVLAKAGTNVWKKGQLHSANIPTELINNAKNAEQVTDLWRKNIPILFSEYLDKKMKQEWKQ
jgi:radical SAM superfamily enzyme YgiQ (UPF0313 family)